MMHYCEICANKSRLVQVDRVVSQVVKFFENYPPTPCTHSYARPRRGFCKHPQHLLFVRLYHPITIAQVAMQFIVPHTIARNLNEAKIQAAAQYSHPICTLLKT